MKVRTKLTLVLVISMLLAGSVSNYIVSEYALRSQLNQLRDKLMTIAQTLAIAVDAEAVSRIPLNPEGMRTSQYRIVEAELLKIKKVVPSLAYIYILEKTEKEGNLKFVIDIHPGTTTVKMPPAQPGDCYDATRFPELLKAFNGPSADTKLVTDEWGIFLSGYAPIRDAAGNVVAILGVDMTAKDVHVVQQKVCILAALVLLLGVIFSFILGMMISGRLTAPLKKLTEGTRHISSGDLQHRVDVQGKDEISELAAAFNEMSGSLDRARKELVSYFYRVVQSLIRGLEARDPYTAGHSDRVADYSVLIARQMGLPKETIDNLKEAALLHDIGKLGVKDAVLNKKDILDAEERRDIERHPTMGEEILKPVTQDKELLNVVREHHEHYDGTGYPDHLKGDEIDILAMIVSAADAYDAMTSHRPYRKNLDAKEAVEQLKQNSGTQFNPKVVNAFIGILRGQGK